MEIKENSYILNHKEENLEDRIESGINKSKYHPSILMKKHKISNGKAFSFKESAKK